MSTETIRSSFNETSSLKHIRPFLKVFKPNTAESFVHLCTYLRQIDDQVDSGQRSTNISEFLTNEQNWLRLHGQYNNQPITKLQQEFYCGTENLLPIQRRRLAYLSTEILDGMKIDCHIMATQQPLSRAKLFQRHITTNAPAFDGLRTLINPTAPIPSRSINYKLLLYYWTNYDSLKDVDKDLSVGLILFPSELLSQYHINPHTTELSDYRPAFEALKVSTFFGLLRHYHHIRDAQLPQPLGSILEPYYFSRAIKVPALKFSVQHSP